jgi:hypothetical protein
MVVAFTAVFYLFHFVGSPVDGAYHHLTRSLLDAVVVVSTFALIVRFVIRPRYK